MKKTILTIVIALTFSLSLQSTADTKSDIEFWQCTEYMSSTDVLVVLVVYKNIEELASLPGLESTLGKISPKHLAIMAEAGISGGLVSIFGKAEAAVIAVIEETELGPVRQWLFGKDFSHRFVLGPSRLFTGGVGYYISSIGSEPQVYFCKQVEKL